MNTAICYFHSKDNPWSGYINLLEQCAARNDDNYSLTALYGVPTRNISTRFPKFQSTINVVKHDELMGRIGKCTRYMVIDPAGSKPWFMCWIAVDATDTWYVYREWPDVNAGRLGDVERGAQVGPTAMRAKRSLATGLGTTLSSFRTV
jgi:hypothetical protein